MLNLSMYEEGVAAGIEQGQHLLLIKLLNKRLGKISKSHIYKLEDLDNNKIIDIALNIFNIKTIEDLNKHLT